jgi:hypothetical protein
MVRVGLFVRLKAKAGREMDVEIRDGRIAAFEVVSELVQT